MSTNPAESKWLPDLFQRLAGISKTTEPSVSDQKLKEDDNNNKTTQVCSCQVGNKMSVLHGCDLDQSDDSGLDLGSGSGRGSPESFSTLSAGTALQGDVPECSSETQSTHSLESHCHRTSCQDEDKNISTEKNANICVDDHVVRKNNCVTSWISDKESGLSESSVGDSAADDDHHITVTGESTDDENEESHQASPEESPTDNEEEETPGDEEDEEDVEGSTHDSDWDTCPDKDPNSSYYDKDGSRNNSESESDDESDVTEHDSDKEKCDGEGEVDSMPGIPCVPGLVTQESNSTVTEYEQGGWITEDDDDNAMNISTTLTGDIGGEYLSGPVNNPGGFSYNHYTGYSSNYNKGWDSDSESEDEYEYLKAFYLPTGHGYALPRRDPKSIKEAVRFWERDFEVRSAIYRKMSSWEDLGLVPNSSHDHEGYAMYAKIRDLNQKWNQCGRSQQLWYRKYAGYTLNEIARLPLNGRVAKTRANPKSYIDLTGNSYSGHKNYAFSSKSSLHLANSEGPNGTVNQKSDPYRARRRRRVADREDHVITYPPGPCSNTTDQEEHVITYPPCPSSNTVEIEDHVITYPQRETNDYGHCWSENVVTYPPTKSAPVLEECYESPSVSAKPSELPLNDAELSHTGGVQCVTNDNHGKLDDIFNFIDSVIGEEDDQSSWRKSNKGVKSPKDCVTSDDGPASVPAVCDSVMTDDNPHQRRNRRLRRRNAVIDTHVLGESDGEPDLEAFWSTDSDCSPSHDSRTGIQ